MTDPDELTELLTRRHGILRSLLEEPMERHVLVDELADSKSTVYKGLTQLEERGLVTSTAAGLRPTLFGIVALERYEELARTARIGDVLADLPPEVVDPSALVGAEAVVPDRRSVDRHLARLERILRTVDSIRGFAPAVSPRTVAAFHDRITDDGLSAELVLTDAIVDYLRGDHPTVLEDCLAVEFVTLYRTDASMPFVLLLATSSSGTDVCIDLGRDGLATALIVNDTAESRRWAEAEFARLKENAEPVSLDALPTE